MRIPDARCILHGASAGCGESVVSSCLSKGRGFRRGILPQSLFRTAMHAIRIWEWNKAASKRRAFLKKPGNDFFSIYS
jgi:hypothetical protein